MMSEPDFSRSPRTNEEPADFSVGYNQSSSDPALTTFEPTSGPLIRRFPRGHTRSRELRGIRKMEQRRSMEENHFVKCHARVNNYNPPVDLRLLDYVSTYDNNLMCPICRCPFVDPVVLTECDHFFCRECILQTWKAYTTLGPIGDCPSCRTPAKLVTKSAPSKILVNMTDELIVRCPKADEGCRAEVKRGEVQDHINIYCGYALVECFSDGCELPVRRKDADQGCLHYGVSCLLCRKEMQKWRLETHWRTECADRKIVCELCKSHVYCRELDEHSKNTCPAITISCPGAALGCTNKSRRGETNMHVEDCILAKLAPVLQSQKERLDEQESAQKQMSRMLEVLENGFATMQSILDPSPKENDSRRSSAGRTEMPLSQYQEELASLEPSQSEVPIQPRSLEFASQIPPMDDTLQTMGSPPSGSAPRAPGPRPSDLPEPFFTDFDLDTPASIPPPDTNGGPYASPLHHLLSMHESLRDEMSRISSALSELDGRHSTQNLNENLRTREEISYLGAQVGGLQRQVHWLTSTQLQRQHNGRSPTPGAAGSSTTISDAAAGAGVEAAVSAVSTAATALRGAARMVNGGTREGNGMRRGPSEEGRTKL